MPSPLSAPLRCLAGEGGHQLLVVTAEYSRVPAAPRPCPRPGPKRTSLHRPRPFWIWSEPVEAGMAGNRLGGQLIGWVGGHEPTESGA